MEGWLQYFSPHTHVSYAPFHDRSCEKIAAGVPTLQKLCKACILKCMTLRRLSSDIDQLGLPSLLCSFLRYLTTKDFVLKDHAPFYDVCGMSYFHKALTYRLRCRLDGEKYLVTHAYWITDTENTKEDVSSWSRVQHPNIMSIHGLVEDTDTGNFFYVFDFPRMSLGGIRHATGMRGLQVPEVFIWRLIADIGSALEYLLGFNLSYQSCDLNNVYVVGDRLALENGLTRKVWDSVSSSESETTQWKKKKTHEAEEEALSNLIKMVQALVFPPRWPYSDSLDTLTKIISKGWSLRLTLDLVQMKLSGSEESICSVPEFMRYLEETNDFRDEYSD